MAHSGFPKVVCHTFSNFKLNSVMTLKIAYNQSVSRICIEAFLALYYVSYLVITALTT